MKYTLFGLALTALLVGTYWAMREQRSQPLTPQARGRELVEEGSCRSCHRLDSSFRAPPLEGVFGSERRLQSGETVRVDEAYLLESLVAPRAKIAEGYAGQMPSYQDIYTKEDLAAIVIYLKELKPMP